MKDVAKKYKKQPNQLWNGKLPPVEKRFKPGQSGNPKGRPSAGASVKEWWNLLHQKTLAEVMAIAQDPRTPLSKLTAARSLLRAASDDMNSAGMPIAGADIDRILEHTVGKPKQAVELTGRDGGPIRTEKARVDYDAIEAEIKQITAGAAVEG